MRKLILFLLVPVLLLVGIGSASATHNGYKYAAPTLTSVQNVGCDPASGASVKVTWKPTGKYTSVNYGLRSDFRASLQWNPWEYTTTAAPKATSTVILGLRPGARHYFRVYAGEFGGHRQSKYSKVRSIVTGSC